MIDSDVVLGDGVCIFNPDQVNIFGCTIGAGSFVGPFVEITRGVTIGERCRIQSHAFICHGVVIEDEVFVGHGVMFVNDLYPRTHRQVVRLSTQVEFGASLGTGATILGGVRIGRYAVVGAGSVVTHDVAPLTMVAGNPARELRRFDDYAAMLAYMEGRQATASGGLAPGTGSRAGA